MEIRHIPLDSLSANIWRQNRSIMLLRSATLTKISSLILLASPYIYVLTLYLLGDYQISSHGNVFTTPWKEYKLPDTITFGIFWMLFQIFIIFLFILILLYFYNSMISTNRIGCGIFVALITVIFFLSFFSSSNLLIGLVFSSNQYNIYLINLTVAYLVVITLLFYFQASGALAVVRCNILMPKRRRTLGYFSDLLWRLVGFQGSLYSKSNRSRVLFTVAILATTIEVFSFSAILEFLSLDLKNKVEIFAQASGSAPGRPYGSLNEDILLLALLIAGVGGYVLSGHIRHRTRTFALMSMDDLIANDPRRPVIFLRPFSDDQVIFAERVHMLPRLILDRGFSHPNFDQMLVEECSPIGPVIALGNPADGDRRPQGAARKYLTHPDDGWEGEVSQLIGLSSRIVFGLASSKSLEWETDEIFKLGAQHRTLFITPPGQPVDWAAVAYAFGKYDVSELSFPDTEELVGFCIDESGYLACFTAKKRTEAAYLATLRLAESFSMQDLRDHEYTSDKYQRTNMFARHV